MCLYPRTVPHRGHDGRVDKVQVFPCGHCAECIKRKQNDYIQRMCMAAREYPTTWFFTFTFSNKAIPLLCKPLNIDEQCNLTPVGLECLKSKKKDELDEIYIDDDFCSMPVRDSWIKNCRKVRRAGREVQLNDPYFYDGLYGIKYSCTATLYNRTIQLIFKQFREFYRKVGISLNWKAVVCGEYGTFGHRPHYHAVIFGLNVEQSKKLQLLWTDRYGRCDADLIPTVSSDGKNHQAFVARYVAKYMTKGSFEDDLVKHEYVYKPRVMTSSNLNQLSDEFVAWYTGKDFIFSQDLPISSYSDNDLDRLIARHKLTVGSHQYNLGRSFKSKLFYTKEKREQLNGEFKVYYKASNLSKALSLRLQSRALARSVSEFEQSTGLSLEDSSPEDCEWFKDSQILDKLQSAQKALSDQKLIYQRSNF